MSIDAEKIKQLKGSMRKGLVYTIYCTAYNRDTKLDTLQIGAIVDTSKCFHGGNVHWLDGLYHDWDIARTTLAAIQEPNHA